MSRPCNPDCQCGRHTPNRRPKVFDPDRFWSKVSKTESCWLWVAGTNDLGYGHFGFGGKTLYAHRFAWELTGRPVPEAGWYHPKDNPQGWVLDHDNPDYGCRNTRCVNPDHLQAVPQKVNIRRPRGPRSNSTTGVRGVYWSARKQKFVVQLRFDGKAHGGGSFTGFGEAKVAVNALHMLLHGVPHPDVSAT